MKCIVSYSDTNTSKQYLNKLSKLGLEEVEVSFDQFLAFKEFIQDDLEYMYEIFKDKGILREEKFKKYYQNLAKLNSA